MKAAISLAAVAFAALPLAACSALVTISEDEIRCVGEGPTDPCPDGRFCRDGFCQPIGAMDSGRPDGDGGCTPDERGEICNGDDDDCDGIVDEGHDLDGDDFTWCGGGVANQADCDDNDPFSYPGDTVTLPATERCDGADNDCDGMIDENDVASPICTPGLECIDRECADPMDCSLPSVECGSGQFCNFTLTPPRCEMGGCAMLGCTVMGEICNAETGECVMPAQVGDDCLTDADCAGTAICIRREALRLSGARVCSQACCTDDQCPSGTICWASGSGAKLCIPPSMVGTSMGASAGGAMCSSHPMCASGLCRDDEGLCVENCGNDDDCTSGDACVSSVISSRDQVHFTCGAPLGGYYQGEVAFGGTCASGLALTDVVGCAAGLGCARICVGPCRTSADCGSPDVEDLNFYCGTSTIDDYAGEVARCSRKNHSGTGADGATCTTNTGCRDLACISDRCADSCCSDMDCGGGGKCRPVQIRGHWETHCI